MPSFDFYEMNEVSVNEGVWFSLDNGIEIKVAKLNNKAYRAMRDSLEKPYSKLVAVGGKIPSAKQDEILAKCLAETVLKDWKNYTDSEGKEIPFTQEKALEQLIKHEPLRDRVVFFAANEEAFRAVQEAVAKN